MSVPDSSEQTHENNMNEQQYQVNDIIQKPTTMSTSFEKFFEKILNT